MPCSFHNQLDNVHSRKVNASLDIYRLSGVDYIIGKVLRAAVIFDVTLAIRLHDKYGYEEGRVSYVGGERRTLAEA